MLKLIDAEVRKNLIIDRIEDSKYTDKLSGMGIYPDTEISIVKRRKGVLYLICGASRILISNIIATTISIK